VRRTYLANTVSRSQSTSPVKNSFAINNADRRSVVAVERRNDGFNVGLDVVSDRPGFSTGSLKEVAPQYDGDQED
jgi:hypothetical protein